MKREGDLSVCVCTGLQSVIFNLEATDAVSKIDDTPVR